MSWRPRKRLLQCNRSPANATDNHKSEQAQDIRYMNQERDPANKYEARSSNDHRNNSVHWNRCGYDRGYRFDSQRSTNGIVHNNASHNNNNQMYRKRQWMRSHPNNHYRNQKQLNPNRKWHRQIQQPHRYRTSSRKYRDRNNVKLVQNTGRFHIENIPIQHYECTLQSIWNQYLSQNVQRIDKIIILCGPPGAGKTKICEIISNYYKLDCMNNADYLLDGSQMASHVMKENERKLIESKMIEKLFEPILMNKYKQKMFIIDGFLRMRRHVLTMDFLQRHLPNVHFIFIVIDVDEETSVQRQIERGIKLKKLMESDPADDGGVLIKRNKIRLKASDLNVLDARKRYRKYANLLHDVKDALRSIMKLQIEPIDGSENLKTIEKEVEHRLRKYDTKKVIGVQSDDEIEMISNDISELTI